MIITMTNPFHELFDTNGALEYLSDHDKPIAKVTLRTRTSLGRLLNPRLKIYFRRELDAYIDGKDYDRDKNQKYEQPLIDTILNSEEAAAYLDLNPTWFKFQVKKGKIRSHKLGGMLFFLRAWLDDYRYTIQSQYGTRDD